LPEVAKNILRLAREAGQAGLELNKVSLGQDKKWLRQLAHQKYITAIDEQIYFDMAVYQALVSQAIGSNQPQDRITLQEIKQRVSLSRKYLIPFVNRMEKDGWLRRDDEVRTILKSSSK
ncbi:SelB C-terminal domain-containing protein, partial [Vibrio fujianensis]|uniref:SelB domain-containing protein n=1 Tax=Vibrio fujianensis TaxID=1974215 RepID=UPI001FE726A5